MTVPTQAEDIIEAAEARVRNRGSLADAVPDKFDQLILVIAAGFRDMTARLERRPAIAWTDIRAQLRDKGPWAALAAVVSGLLNRVF